MAEFPNWNLKNKHDVIDLIYLKARDIDPDEILTIQMRTPLGDKDVQTTKGELFITGLSTLVNSPSRNLGYKWGGLTPNELDNMEKNVKKIWSKAMKDKAK